MRKSSLEGGHKAQAKDMQQHFAELTDVEENYRALCSFMLPPGEDA